MILECIRCIFICIILISCWNIIHKPAQNGGFFLSFLCQDSLDWSELLQTPILPEMIGRCVMLRWKLHCFFGGFGSSTGKGLNMRSIYGEPMVNTYSPHTLFVCTIYASCRYDTTHFWPPFAARIGRLSGQLRAHLINSATRRSIAGDWWEPPATVC